MPATQNQTIAQKLAALEVLLAWFESEEVTVEVALKKYEEALQLASELEEQLAKAKNQIEVISKKYVSS